MQAVIAPKGLQPAKVQRADAAAVALFTDPEVKEAMSTPCKVISVGPADKAIPLFRSWLAKVAQQLKKAGVDAQQRASEGARGSVPKAHDDGAGGWQKHRFAATIALERAGVGPQRAVRGRNILMVHLLGVLLVSVAFPVAAQTSPWSLHLGPGFVMLYVKAQPEAPPGTPIPGAGLDADNGTTLGLETAYDLSPDLTARLTVGVPVKTDVSASGSVAAVGKAGDMTYGPGVLSATWAFGRFGPFRPYVGGGAAYLKVFSSHDAGVTAFRVENAWGSTLQLGTDIDIGSRVGLFVDVKKIYLKTRVTGNVLALGGAPTFAKARVDPSVVHVGFAYRF